MGSFSWFKADNLTNQVSICYDDPYKLLIPKEFGGGFIYDHYRDYGEIYDGNTRKFYDFYELLAFWNAGCIIPNSHNQDNAGKAPIQLLEWDDNFTGLKPKDKYTNNNRVIGVDLACYDDEMALLKYPLKLVSARYKGTYEDCLGISYSDPDQGFQRTTMESSQYQRIIFNRRRLFTEKDIKEELAYMGLLK